MKAESARALALGLSTITLSGAVSFTVQAEATEDSDSLVSVPSEEASVDNQANEATVEEEAITLSESIDETVPDTVNGTEIPEAAVAKEQVSEAAEAVHNITKAKEAMTDASDELSSIAETTEDSTDEALLITGEAESIAQAAGNAVLAEDTLKEDALSIIADAEKTIDQATTDFNAAKDTYDSALDSFEAAKEDYDTAVVAYNNNKTEAIADLDSARKALDDASARFDEMQAQLEAAKEALVSAGAQALISAEDNKVDVTSYIEAVVKYYYVPNKELAEGQQISDFTVTGTNDDYVSITYNIVDEAGNILRTVDADYGYTLDTSTGAVNIYDNKLCYEYTDASGQVIRLTKEQAQELDDNRVEIGRYFTATGFYIPRYQDKVNYRGYISIVNYTDAKAIAQGKSLISEEYSDERYYLNPVIEYANGTKTPILIAYSLNLNYNVFYDQVETYYVGKQAPDYDVAVEQLASSGKLVISSLDEYNRGIIRYVQQYAVSDNVASAEYSSYNEAIAAVVKEADRTHGTSGIDVTNSSNLSIEEKIKYATLFEKHINDDNPFFTNLDSEYTNYISSVRMKLKEYATLLSNIKEAKDNYEAAQARVIKLEDDIKKLDGANDIESAARLAVLQAKLDTAKLNLETAKENLESSKAYLSDAKAAFDNRFNVRLETPVTPVMPIAPQINQGVINNMIIDAVDVPAEEEPEELQEEELQEEELEATPEAPTNNDVRNGGQGEASEASAPEEPVEDTATDEPVTIPEEETPKAITIAGLLARGKWFIGLAGVSTAGIGVAVIEAKHRAAIKLLDKLNQ